MVSDEAHDLRVAATERERHCSVARHCAHVGVHSLKQSEKHSQLIKGQRKNNEGFFMFEEIDKQTKGRGGLYSCDAECCHRVHVNSEYNLRIVHARIDDHI